MSFYQYQVQAKRPLDLRWHDVDEPFGTLDGAEAELERQKVHPSNIGVDLLWTVARRTVGDWEHPHRITRTLPLVDQGQTKENTQ